MRDIKKHLAGAVLACATGCSNPPPVEELTEEQKQIVETLVTHLNATESFHAALVGQAKTQAAFDADGNVGPEAYQESLSEAIDLAQQLQDQERFFGYYASEATGRYATSNAFFDVDENGPYVGLNLEEGVLENLPSSSILHETMHDQYASHHPEVSHEIDGLQSDFDYQDPGFVDLVLSEHDLPYLASLYGDVGDTVTWYAQAISTDAMIDMYEQNGKSPEEIYELLLQQPIAQGKNVWLNDSIDGMYSHYLTTLGVNKNELRETLMASTAFYEPSHEQFMEELEAYYREYVEGQEVRAEMHSARKR